jgi:L-threonylcarbamoyladenylate synthase
MKTRVHAPTPAALKRLAAALRRGELVALPTETVYGLAAHALDARACRRIFTAKRRPADDPLIVHVATRREAEKLAEFSPAARVLAREFWPGPLTLVLPKKPVVPAIVTSGQPTVALRSPAHPLARRLLRESGVPLAAPSANPFGYVSPTTAAHVLEGLKGRIPHVLDGGPCRVGVESTIVDLTEPTRPRILRPGAVSGRAIMAALRAAGLPARLARKAKSRAEQPVIAPGMLAQHYSPHTPLELRDRIAVGDAQPGTALVYWRTPRASKFRHEASFSLSGSGRPEEAAHALYATLRRADRLGVERIVCERAPRSAGELGRAINDRLARAAGRRSSTG